jgi:hypothetical protein
VFWRWVHVPNTDVLQRIGMALNVLYARSIQHPFVINCGNFIKTLHFDLMLGDQLRTRVDLYEYIHTVKDETVQVFSSFEKVGL